MSSSRYPISSVRRLVGVLVALAALDCTAAVGQVRPPVATLPAAPRQPVVQPTQSGQVSRDYVVGPGDLLNIGVFGLNELSQVVRVSNSGKIHLAQLGILKVAGRTPAQLESDIGSQLREKQLVVDPWVVVRVTEARAHPVYALGEVMMPGQFQITDEMYLSDLVTLSQGVNDLASPIAYLYRRKANPVTGDFDPTQDPDTDEMEGMPVDLRALQTGEQPEINVKLRGGDILYVPERRKEYFFVIGDVYTPGLFDLVPGQAPLRLSQAMARAGGPTRTAKPSRVLVVRYAPDGSRQEMTVDFRAVMRGREPDPPIQFGDVVFVPGSKFKNAALAMVGIIPGVVQGRATQR